MGSDPLVDKNFHEDERPQHIVELSEYFIGKYTITHQEYQAFVHDAKYAPPCNWIGDRFPTKKGKSPSYTCFLVRCCFIL